MNSPRLLCVLVVDDSPHVRARLRRLLEESDSRCVVTEAGTAADVARALKSLRPDVVVLDLSLPDGNGFELLPFIKRVAPKCSVILLTNHEGPSIRERAIDLGADYVFRKSIEFELVPVVMQRVTERLRSGGTSTPKPLNQLKGGPR